MLGKRYHLDREKLLFRRVRLSFREKLRRLGIGFFISLLLATLYGIGFKKVFGSPKEDRLLAQIEEMKFRYSLLEQDYRRIDNTLDNIAAAENSVYRPVLDMEPLPESFRISGYGGSRKQVEMDGYMNSALLKRTASYLDELQRKAYVQSKSFEEIIPEAADWKNKLEHIPYIPPVKVSIPLGDGIKFRDEHPVLGISRWHYGQDFSAPVGTRVYATGSGVVTRASWTPHGFGNRIEIDHGYGFTTIYGHLSSFEVEEGQVIKRGELIGLSGSTGISSGPHLHYEIHYNGKVQNPIHFFNDDLTLAEYKEMIAALEADTIK